LFASSNFNSGIVKFFGRSLLPIPTVPVSYTHLDVYKRQNIHFSFSTSGLFSWNKRKLNRFSDTDCYIPVSYTHLDVYKRQV
ncbi:hypothetical protein, partial [Enterococcus sp. 6D12_DIV0197]|uniref:hypothetical protein n=1 Tax=Enterococcus sp. 6D12_DIV0197 TaxID=1834184 RepID=UPI001BAF48DF